jgi:hypothetical protein
MGFWEWAITIFLMLGGVAYLIEKSTEEGLEWDVVWYFLKRIFGFCLTMLFIPLIIIYGVWADKKRIK